LKIYEAAKIKIFFLSPFIKKYSFAFFDEHFNKINFPHRFYSKSYIFYIFVCLFRLNTISGMVIVRYFLPPNTTGRINKGGFRGEKNGTYEYA